MYTLRRPRMSERAALKAIPAIQNGHDAISRNSIVERSKPSTDSPYLRT